MRARQQLAALNHNHNVGREQARTAGGAERWKLVFPKAKKQWVAKKMYEKKTTTYLYDMHDVLSAKKELVAGKIPVCVSDFPPVPASIPANIATKPSPAKHDVIAQHVSRIE